MKQIVRHLAAVSLALLLPLGSLSAEQFFGFGLGLMSNLGDVGGTIAKDGVDSLVGTPTKIGGQFGTGCEAAADRTTCLREQPGDAQRLVIPERILTDYERNSAGAIRSKTSKTMLGLELNLLYERQMDWAFFRADLQHVRRIHGGQSSSKVIGLEWYRAHWNFHRTNIPVFFGIKANIGEKTAFYIAPGLSYIDGVVSLKLDNFGDLPTTLLGGSSTTFGTVTVIDATGRTTGGAIIDEHAVFRARGLGLNFLIGAEAKLASGNRFFVEMHRVIGGDYSTTSADSLGTHSHLSRLATLAINLSGTVFRVGMKWEL